MCVFIQAFYSQIQSFRGLDATCTKEMRSKEHNDSPLSLCCFFGACYNASAVSMGKHAYGRGRDELSIGKMGRKWGIIPQGKSKFGRGTKSPYWVNI